MDDVEEEDMYQSDTAMDENHYWAFQGKKKPFQSTDKKEKKGESVKTSQQS